MSVLLHAHSPVRMSLGISALFSTFIFGIGLFLPYFPVYLEGLQFTPVQIAVLASLPNLVKVVSTPLLTSLSDKSGRRRRSIALYALFCVLSLVALSQTDTYAVVFGIVLVFSFFLAPLQPLSDAYAFEAVNNCGIDYGKPRAVGSGFFIIATMFGGWYIGFGPSVHLLYFIAAAFCLLIWMALALPPMPSEHRREMQQGTVDGNELKTASLHIMLLATGLVLGSLGALFSFGSIFWLANGLSDSQVGLLWSAGVVAEICVFLVGQRLIKRFGVFQLIIIGSLGALVRWVLFPIADGFWSALALQLLHAFNFGMVFIALMNYLSKSISAARLGTAQGLSQTYIGLFTGLTGVLSGWLYEMSPAYAFYSMALIVLAGVVLLLATRSTVERQISATA
ncbi:MFS transporter [Polycladidibacter hongkongensis]|uniref:MFS transporter n=1 Tax=Polycladidibacter hongkongensis TaxID=1647556 RepID=UPI00082A0563|nr:MFS transporter [Pseudovibrio hongkongensis]